MTLAVQGLKTHIRNNNLKSMILLALYPVLILGMVWACAYIIFGLQTDYNSGAPVLSANRVFYDFAPTVLAVVVIWFIAAWFFHTRLVRSLSHSHPVTRQQEPELYNLLENLSITAGVPMPRLEIIETHARNAFASGINTASFTVTVTRGLLNSLTREEVEAVLAHELTHILNRDVRLLIITIIFTGMVGFAAQMIWSHIRYGFIFRGGNGRDKGGGILVMLIIAIVLWVGYMATLLTRFAISRKREYMADAGAVELTKNPRAMMSALMRIAGRDRIPGGADDIAMMCIENAKPFLGVFATHPPIEKRIRALSLTTGESIPDSASLPPIGMDKSFGQPHQNNPWLTRLRGSRKKNPWH